MRLDLVVYILFALAVFFSFGLIILAAIALLIAFLIIDKIKKGDPNKAKKLNRIGIIVLIIVIIIGVVLPAIMASLFLSSISKLIPVG